VQVEPDNHTWLHTLAKAELRMSRVQRFRGDLELGRQHADEAVRIGEKLVAVLPADPQVNLSLALAMSAPAGILRDKGYRENPLADLRRSAEITKLFLNTIGDSVPHLTELADTHMGMASCLGRLYRYDEAWTELQEALRIYRELCASEPDSSETQSRLATCLINLAAWHIRMRSTENDESAVELFDEAEAILRDLCDSGRTEGRDLKFVEKLDAIERNRQIIAGRHDSAAGREAP
jgi:tetratricopeptide (TPR) repeat protein